MQNSFGYLIRVKIQEFNELGGITLKSIAI